MLLTPEELLLALPTLSLTNQEAEFQITRSQSVVEGAFGANRNLEISPFLEERPLTVDGVINLANFPLIATQPVTVKIKLPSFFVYGGAGIAPEQWRDLVEGEFYIDAESNKVTIAPALTGFGIPSPTLHRPKPPKIKVNYHAGYDFSPGSQDPDVKKMKSALISMIEIITSQYGIKGIKTLSSDEDRIDYFNPSVIQNSKYLDFLSVFRKYRARGRI